MKILFDQFRCFGETQGAEVAPLTILVGENSSGKSTFMAGLRYMLDFTGGGVSPSFNKDPFYLGGYKNIAHFRGGKYGRAATFSIAISDSMRISPRQRENRDLFEDLDTGEPQVVSLELSFNDREGDAVVSGYKISIGSKTVDIDISRPEATALITDHLDGFEQQLNLTERSFLISRGDFVSLDYFLQDIVYSINDAKRDDAAENRAVRIVEQVWQLFRRLPARRMSRVQALAPVRTRPQRNYDPTLLSESSEGDQLIGRLGRVARTDAKQWSRLKGNLERFGHETGLFENISIRKLGTSESNPFQINVRKAGREANIIDVGYGVSQILPIFILLSETRSSTTLLIQQPEVHLHPSAQAALGTVLASNAGRRTRPDIVVETHSDFLIDRIRKAVRDGTVSPQMVSILYFEKTGHNSKIFQIKLDKSGDILSAPKSYREFFRKEAFANLGL